MTDTASTKADAAPFIRRVGKAEREADPVGFWSLRAYAIDRAQAASGKVWTDYNLHDPGVTLIEAACYAMTELVYWADVDIADQLRGPDGRIDFDRLALFPPEEVFPCRATTPADLRRVILDHDPTLRDVRLATGEAAPPPGLIGLRLLLDDSGGEHPDHVAAALEKSRSLARAAYRGHRGLGEDLDEDIGLIEARPCFLRLDADLSGGRDPVDVLAEIYEVCDAFVAPAPHARDLQALRLQNTTLEEIFTGPATRAGFIDEAELSGVGDVADQVSCSELRARLLEIDGVTGIGALALEVQGAAYPEIGILTWRGDLWAPRLQTPLRHAASGESAATIVARVKLRWRGVVIQPDAERVAARYADLRAGRRRRGRSAHIHTGPFDQPPPTAVADDGSVQESIRRLFPPLYGVGDDQTPGSADPTLGASPAQFRTYLALFDQLLVNGGEQLRHVRDLFSAHGHLDQSYWPRLVDDSITPGLDALYDRPTIEGAQHAIFDRYDNARNRRGRVLDYLLALHGEVFPQDAVSQFLDYLDTDDLAVAVLESKATFLKQVVVLGRDRAAGFDYGRPLWTSSHGGEDHTPGPHSRIALLIGFRHVAARSLASPLSGAERRAGSIFPHDAEGAAGLEPTLVGPRPAPRPLAWPPARREPPHAKPRRLLPDRTVSPEALFQLGVDRQRYGWIPDGDEAATAGRLVLGVADQPQWWELGHFASEREAGHAAEWLRRRMLRLTEACEGLHIVEHILLRARAGKASTADKALRVTLVFPGWTARTARPAFRHFAEEVARSQLPAHLDSRCLWLSVADMTAFEDRFAAWLRVLQHAGDPAHAADLDSAAQAVLDLLAPAWAPSGAGGG